MLLEPWANDHPHRHLSADGTKDSYRLEVCMIYNGLEDHELVPRESMLFVNYLILLLLQAYVMRKFNYRYPVRQYRKFQNSFFRCIRIKYRHIKNQRLRRSLDALNLRNMFLLNHVEHQNILAKLFFPMSAFIVSMQM